MLVQGPEFVTAYISASIYICICKHLCGHNIVFIARIYGISVRGYVLEFMLEFVLA
jgi:hypothetical protein